MSTQSIIVLSVVAISSVAAQHFSQAAPPDETGLPPTLWSSPTGFPAHTWSGTPTWHSWPSSVEPSAPWSPVVKPSPPPFPESHTYQPAYTSPWSSIVHPPPTWTPEAPSWQSWSSTAYISHSWPLPPPSPPPPPPPAPPALPSLNDALIAAGAAKFAALIVSDPTVSAAYSGGVPLIFAPTDEYIDSTFSRLSKRQSTLTPAQQQQLLLHATQAQSDINGLRTPPGKVVPTKDTKAKLKGTVQKVVTDPRNKTKTKTKSSRRWASAILPRQDNASFTPLVNVYSGLGNSVGVITADIPFDGGLIQTTDGLFTVPLVLSATAEATGQTTFVSLTNGSNQTSILDNTPLITVFIPTNDAFAAANISTASSGTASLLSAHVVPNFAGYLPSLTNGSTFTTQDGTVVTVSIQGDDYYVNDAKIVSSNLILDNGVAHVIDSVLTPIPTVAPYTGAGSSVHAGAKSILLASSAIITTLCLL